MKENLAAKEKAEKLENPQQKPRITLKKHSVFFLLFLGKYLEVK